MISWLINSIAGNYNQKQLNTIQPLVDKINKQDNAWMDLSDEDIKAKTSEFQMRLQKGESTDDIMIEAFATVKQACRRLVGTKTTIWETIMERNMIPYDVQLVWGIVLHQWRIGEMKTWEWKTLVATLPAYLNALTGKWVHVVTVNDYLASRDAAWMGILYNRLGLSVWIVTDKSSLEKRREEYEKDITYVQNSQLWFDYLRDNLVKSIEERKLLWRPLHYALIDEIDSILIDEARTPLIISEPDKAPTDKYQHYFNIVRSLIPSKGKKKVSKWFLHDMLNDVKKDKNDTDPEDDTSGDYYIDEKTKTVSLSGDGIEKLEKMLQVENLYRDIWYEEIHHIENALKAYAVYENDKEYIVRDGEVVIIDQNTGRAMSGRRFGNWLHQAIEAKEGVAIKRESKTLATITYQNFFKNYEKLSGMTGTALTEAEEFDSIYDLEVIQIPTNKPIIRVDKNDKVMYDQWAKRKNIYDHISFYHEMWQPILIGTANIHTSETVSRILNQHNIIHSVLNAKYHEQEAQIVSQAWTKWSVVVATNMAWRGTDIKIAQDLNTHLAKNYAIRTKRQLNKNHWLLLYTFSELESQLTLDALVEQGLFTNNQIKQATNKKLSLWEITLKISYNTKRKENTEAYMTISLQPSGENDKSNENETIQKDLHYWLFILWTEKHESRRIDNQLRWRAGRQGDPWVSVFFVAFDDEIMRKMWWDKIKTIAWLMMNKDQLGTMEFTQSRFTDAIIRAQKQMEGYLFGIRKHLFEYDSVIDKQRKNIYETRDIMLFALQKSQQEKREKEETDQDLVVTHLQWFVPSVVDQFQQTHTVLKTPKDDMVEILDKEFSLTLDTNHFKETDKKTLGKHIEQHILTQIEKTVEHFTEVKNENPSAPDSQMLLTQLYIKTLDRQWIEHIDTMQHTRDKVWLMWYAQQDPLVEYKKEAFAKFNSLQYNTKLQTIISVCNFANKTKERTEAQQMQEKIQHAAQNAKPLAPRIFKQEKKEVSSFNESGIEVIELEEESITKPQTFFQPESKKIRPNDKITVRYKNWTIKHDVKYKKIEKDIENWDAEIV